MSCLSQSRGERHYCPCFLSRHEMPSPPLCSFSDTNSVKSLLPLSAPSPTRMLRSACLPFSAVRRGTTNAEIVESFHADREGVIGDKILSEGFEVNTPGKTNSSNARSYNRVEPSEGMNFENANDAMTFYNTYGRNVGFGTCVISSKWKEGKCIFRHLGCWRNGKSRRKAEAMNHRDYPKIGCNASMKVKVDKTSEKHVFYELILEHNH
ncbi:hypothetical protein Taro_000746, partial [Colocasia esculenta]|nr:hypothetical protein [Colocasia esculenta]